MKNSNTVLLVEETGVPGENHRPAASHWQTLSHNVVSNTSRYEWIQSHNVTIIENCTTSLYLPFPINPIFRTGLFIVFYKHSPVFFKEKFKFNQMLMWA
jgi:hypothetical protein